MARRDGAGNGSMIEAKNAASMLRKAATLPLVFSAQSGTVWPTPAMSAKRFYHLVLLAALPAWSVVVGRAQEETRVARVIQTTEAIFPTTVGTRELDYGTADIVINVDADGKLADWLVVSYTDEAFADEAVRVLKEWKYEPARSNGVAVGSLLDLAFEFRAHLKVIETNASDPYHGRIASVLGPRVTHLLCPAHDLDRPVTPLQTVAPPSAQALGRAAAAGGRVVVRFYVDREGRPRMPVIVSATEPGLAQAAVDALSQWRFEPPTLAGRPVAVRAEEEFVFSQRS
jgi:TonB family protein